MADSARSPSLTLALLEVVTRRCDDPLAALMARHGFDPKRGGRLVLPERYRRLWPEGAAPGYVAFSKMLKDAVLFRLPAINFFKPGPYA